MQEQLMRLYKLSKKYKTTNKKLGNLTTHTKKHLFTHGL
jgi:hypothetical protein